MSIFDGHEDKSSKELADELGISDLSVINDTRKNITETLEPLDSTDDSKEILDNPKESGKEKEINTNIWTNNFSISTVRVGTKVLKTTTGNTGTITQILDEEPKISVKMDVIPNIIKMNAQVFLDYFLIQKERDSDSPLEITDMPDGIEIDTDIWTNDYEFNHIGIGTNILKTTTGNTGVITEIREKDPRIRVEMDGVPNGIWVREEDFLKEFFIKKEDKHEVFIGLSGKEIKANNWDLYFDIKLLQIGTRVRDFNNKVGKIKHINISKDIVLLIMEDCSGESYNIADFQAKYMVYKKDLLTFTTLGENITKNMAVWESIPKNIDELQRGARLLHLNNNKVYHILDIEPNRITLINLENNEISYRTLKNLEELFFIYDNDVKIF